MKAAAINCSLPSELFLSQSYDLMINTMVHRGEDPTERQCT